MPQLMRVTGVATSVITDDDWTHVRYHKTNVVSFNATHVILRTDGWFTATTKVRMNQTATLFKLGFRVAADKGEWAVYTLPHGSNHQRVIRFNGANTLVLRRIGGSVERAEDAHE